MRTKSFFRSIALFAAITLAIPAFAKPVTKTINLSQTSKIGQAELKPGEYRLQIDENKATVRQGSKVVAESEGRWEDHNDKPAHDSVVIGENGRVTEVRFEGQSRVFVFNE